eukprot:UN04174
MKIVIIKMNKKIYHLNVSYILNNNNLFFFLILYSIINYFVYKSFLCFSNNILDTILLTMSTNL